MEETFEKTKSDDADVATQAKIDLQELSQHTMELATSLLTFGGDKHGIFSAQPVDLMHAFLEGIVDTLVPSASVVLSLVAAQKLIWCFSNDAVLSF
eukprot:scaffold17975_cov55-Attheya_sp.AAC.3